MMAWPLQKFNAFSGKKVVVDGVLQPVSLVKAH